MDDDPLDKPLDFSKLKTMSQIAKENTLLRRGLKNLWLNAKYHEEYVALLMGEHSDEEFEHIAEQHATIPDAATKEEMEKAYAVFQPLLGDLSLSDVCILLNLTLPEAAKVMEGE
jgi:hypothetical protein